MSVLFVCKTNSSVELRSMPGDHLFLLYLLFPITVSPPFDKGLQTLISFSGDFRGTSGCDYKQKWIYSFLFSHLSSPILADETSENELAIVSCLICPHQ